MAKLIKSNFYTIYCGDRSDQFFPDHHHKAHDVFDAIRKKLGATQITFLQQVHGADVVFVEKTQQKNRCLYIHEQHGDALITNQPGCAIGVLTADCLPVVLYDQKNHAAAVVHAGWRGSVGNILPKTITMMKKHFGSSPQNIIAYFGPSAGVCCYEVGDDFCDNVKDVHERVFVKKDNKLFFNNVKYNLLQLFDAGVLQKNIKTLSSAGDQRTACTMCNKSYHSYRREGISAGRQATVVVLQKK